MDREELAGLLQDLCSDNNRVQIKALVALGPHVEDRSALKSLAQPLKVRTQPGLLEKVVAFLRDDAGTALLPLLESLAADSDHPAAGRIAQGLGVKNSLASRLDVGPTQHSEAPATGRTETRIAQELSAIATTLQGLAQAARSEDPSQIIFEEPLAEAVRYEHSLQEVLEGAHQQEASDIHFSAGYPPTFRSHGAMRSQKMTVLKNGHVAWILRQLLRPTDLESFRQTAEFDGVADLGDSGRFRVNAYLDSNGYGLVLRVIPRRVQTLEQLDSPKVITELMHRPRGLILVTGPTGSGKTTTCAAMINYVNRTFQKHVITVEDPIEIVHTPMKSKITQRQVGMHTRTFAAALRSALREDPDVILVGEMRDLETIELAITAAETGQLVLGTLHTLSAPKTIDRIVNVFPAQQQTQIRTMLAESLLGVISQVLLPRLDGTGRAVAYEIMIRVPAISNLIRESKVFQIPNIMLSNTKMGMKVLDTELKALVEKGLVDELLAREYANDKESFSVRGGNRTLREFDIAPLR